MVISLARLLVSITWNRIVLHTHSRSAACSAVGFLMAQIGTVFSQYKVDVVV